MPFLKLDNAWSDLASSYNQNFSNKPSIPSTNYNSFDDGLIRGGLLNATLSSVRDTARIGKFFASGKGVLFLAKQVGLQKSNPQLEQSSSSNLNFIDRGNNNTRLYNLGLNTLAQVPINAFGGHIIRHGITPVGGVGFLEGDSKENIKGYNYEKIVLGNNDIGKNRLVGYLDKIANNTTGSTPTTLLTYNGGASSVYGIGSTSITTTTLKTDKYSEKFLSYNGLKGYFEIYRSNANAGTLKFIEDTKSQSSFANYGRNQAKFLQSIADIGQSKAYEYEKLIDKNGTNSLEAYAPVDEYSNKAITLNTVANQLNKEASQLEKEAAERSKQSEKNFGTNKNADFTIWRHEGYNKANIQSRIGVGTSQYGPNGSKLNSTVDSINAINVVNSQVFYQNSLKSNTDVKIPYALNKGDKEISGNFGRDIIKFRIEFLNNDNPTYVITDPNNNDKVVDSGLNTDVLAFRAYLDDFSDGMNAKWNPYRYMGRGEEFYVYEGFTRDISVAFTLHAHSEEEMRPMYQKLNYLISSFTPDYSPSGKMRGNIGYLTVGDYLYRQPGVFTDIKLSGMLDAGWEIGIEENGDFNGQYEVPKHIKVALSFKPIHTFLPRKVKYKENEDKTKNINEINAPFVTLDKVAYPAQAGERFEYDKEGNVVKDDKGNWVRKTKAKNVYLD
jgi:hypothetical protein